MIGLNAHNSKDDFIQVIVHELEILDLCKWFYKF